MARCEALVTPSVMSWAREKAGYDISTAAEKIGRPASDITAWEDGLMRPTLAQARKASEIYKRSLAVFYLPEPPADFDTLRDFRQLPSRSMMEYSPELALLVRQVHVRQEWLREFLVFEGAKKLPFVGKATPNSSPQEVALSIRQEFGVSPRDQMHCSQPRDALNLWIEKAEDSGISICRQGKIESEEARGFVLADPYAPFVYINSADAVVAQLFTLAHELSHIWINAPGISNLEGLGKKPRTEEDRIEIFCNRVAAEILIDSQEFDKQWGATSKQELKEKIEDLSGIFKVSEEAVARRLLDKHVITIQDYQKLREFYKKRWREHTRRERERASGGNYYYAKVATNGRTFTQTVLAAYRSAVISVRETSSILGVKANHLAKLAAHADVSMGSVT